MGDSDSGGESSRERKIMVAVDEGEESEYALTWCLKNIIHSRGINSKDILILLYAKSPGAAAGGSGYTSLLDRLDVDGGTTGGGYHLLSSDVIETMEKYKNEVAQCVINKFKRICNEIIKQAAVKVVETMVLTGDPRDVICETAEKLDVDMLVMGTHGYGLIKRAFLGSVSNHCAQNVKCPVLIVKTPKPNPNPTTHSSPHQHIK